MWSFPRADALALQPRLECVWFGPVRMRGQRSCVFDPTVTPAPCLYFSTRVFRSLKIYGKKSPIRRFVSPIALGTRLRRSDRVVKIRLNRIAQVFPCYFMHPGNVRRKSPFSLHARVRISSTSYFFLFFFFVRVYPKDTRGALGPRDGRSRTRWPLTGTSTPCDLTTSTQLASIDMQYEQAPCAFVLHSRFLRRRSNRPRVTGACASLTSSSGSLWRRRALRHHTPSSRRRRATTTGGLQPRLSISRAARQGSCLGRLLLLGQHDGPASARSLRFVAFSAGQKAEAASYKK